MTSKLKCIELKGEYWTKNYYIWMERVGTVEWFEKKIKKIRLSKRELWSTEVSNLTPPLFRGQRGQIGGISDDVMRWEEANCRSHDHVRTWAIVYKLPYICIWLESFESVFFTWVLILLYNCCFGICGIAHLYNNGNICDLQWWPRRLNNGLWTWKRYG